MTFLKIGDSISTHTVIPEYETPDSTDPTVEVKTQKKCLTCGAVWSDDLDCPNILCESNND